MYIVYTIKDIREDRVVYVGKTNDFKIRKRDHLWLRTNTSDWLSVIGTDNVEIIPAAEFDSEEEALKYEDELITQYDSINNGYNKNRSGLIESGRKSKYRQEWNQEHPEYNKEYYRDNIDKEKERVKKYYQEHTEYWKERNKTEEYKQYHRDYYQAQKLGMTVDEYRQREVG